MKVDCISDLHGHYPDLEGGDLLIVAGDCCPVGGLTIWSNFFSWLRRQRYEKKIVIGGNHDNFLFSHFPKNKEEVDRHLDNWDLPESILKIHERGDFVYLYDSSTEYKGFKIYGSPWTVKLPYANPLCKAFTVSSEEELKDKFDLIPNDSDIVITHTPPYGILDKCNDTHIGSKSLRHKMFNVNPKLMVFGHVHGCGGQIVDLCVTRCVNASYVNELYKPINKIVTLEL